MVHIPVDSAFYKGHFNGEEVHQHELRGKCLRSGNCNLRTGFGIEHMIRLPGDTRSLHIYNSKGSNPVFPCDAQRLKAVRCLSGLGNHDYKGVGSRKNPAIPVFRCQFHTYRDLCQILHNVLGRHAGMPCRAAGDDTYRICFLKKLISKSGVAEINPVLFKKRLQGVSHSLGLLMDLLHHEMLISVFFSACCVPGHLCFRNRDLIAVQVIKMSLSGDNPYRLMIPDIVHFPGVVQHRRHIRGQKGFVPGYADDHGTVFSRRVDFPRIILEHQSEGIAAPHPDHHPVDRIDRSDLIFVVIIIDNLDRDLCVRIAVELISVPEQLCLQLLIIFDDPVVHPDHCGS